MPPGANAPVLVKSWLALGRLATERYTPDFVNGPSNAHATRRLFGQDVKPRVVLFRDNHAWCPYCQKIWLFLEEKQIPYEVQKVTMFCYGEKERWYKKIVPSGMLPAIAIDNQLVTESDVILEALEKTFGPLAHPMNAPEVMKNRKLERGLFRSWCQWLCYPSRSAQEEAMAKRDFENWCSTLEQRMSQTETNYFGSGFGISDTILAPYIERMQSSLYYFKGWNMREHHPRIDAWFSAMESRPTYRGTKSDHHSHVHDLPPQMGGCYFDEHLMRSDRRVEAAVAACVDAVDAPAGAAPAREIDEKVWAEPGDAAHLWEAVSRVCKHQAVLAQINPYAKTGAFDVSLRAALTILADEALCAEGASTECPDSEPLHQLPPHGPQALRYIRDRLCVPRDMGFWAGRRLRQSLERTAVEYGRPEDVAAPNEHPIPTKHRRDSTPVPFRKASA
eukprot:TRINITY_DN1159_c1_g2_i1.p2 TRINITY_DN1159_c1_g2~~TRINITY_DN1159_c1_g2_i1.p2  ORF type:complete len:464 (+),score=133.29 TRINITY_DN1159_c1_g2_i1:51-1394(+)